jgi:hypothetical protein
MSSDHLVVDLGDHAAVVGDELAFGVGYGGLLRAMTSPFVAIVELDASLVEEGALAPVTRPGETSTDRLRGLVTGLRPSSTSGV